MSPLGVIKETHITFQKIKLMRLFDFFKRNSTNPSMDLSNVKFISDGHIRYQNGQDASGHNKDCWRGVIIQNNISGGQGYTVTIYNLDGDHSLWGDNIQMAPKQMEIEEQSSSSIKLRGFGTDQMGGSFADYGLTISINNSTIEKVTLHMHDRNIDIVYFKATNAETEQTQVAAPKQTVPIPSTDITQVMALRKLIHNCQDLPSLNHLYNQKGNFNHPQIGYDFGVSFLIKGDKANAKKALTQGAIYGLQYPCPIYNHALIDSVGQCLSLLITQFPIADSSKAMEITSLGYIYLSRCIELHPRRTQDSYKTRALLFKDHENPMVVQSLIMENVGMGILVAPYIISDFYFSSQADGSPHQNCYQIAKRIHQGLNDMTIGGKDADDYSLDEMAEFGEKRHLMLFKTLEQKYKNGEFNLTIEELKNTSR
jgi:hypothetical protein